MTAEERLEAPGQKKILALDGGGIRGTITIEVLAGIEDILNGADVAVEAAGNKAMADGVDVERASGRGHRKRQSARGGIVGPLLDETRGRHGVEPVADVRLDASIDALPAVDVIGRDANGFGHDDLRYRPSGTEDEAQIRLDGGPE